MRGLRWARLLGVTRGIKVTGTGLAAHAWQVPVTVRNLERTCSIDMNLSPAIISVLR